MRIKSEPPRNNSWIEYHKEMTRNHRYFVTGDGVEPFYTDEGLNDINARIKGDFIDVFLCDWDSDKWDVQPYRYVFSKKGDVSEFFARAGTPRDFLKLNRPAGIKKNGEWQELYYLDSTRDFPSSFFWSRDGYCSVIHNAGPFIREASGTWRQWRGDKTFELTDPPLDELITLARRINAMKWRGFYQPIIDFLISEGMNKTQI